MISITFLPGAAFCHDHLSRFDDSFFDIWVDCLMSVFGRFSYLQYRFWISSLYCYHSRGASINCNGRQFSPMMRADYTLIFADTI